MKNFLKDRFNFSSSVLFFLFLGFFQSPFFEYELGILTSYVNNFNALNEITFWSSFYGDSLFESSSLSTQCLRSRTLTLGSSPLSILFFTTIFDLLI